MTSTDTACWCVVPAAGSGRRFGGDIPKQYVEIGGKPLRAWTLERLAAHPRIAGIVVVLAAGDSHWPGFQSCRGKQVLTAIGGSERADSVLAGLHALPAGIGAQDFILVHDAARPFVRHADIDLLFERGMPAGGALLAAPLSDTLKRADAHGRSEATESREARWRALTPQMFRRGDLIDALVSARDAGIVVTDEAMAMERAGFRPLLVEGSEDNIKITTGADRVFAEYLFERESERTSREHANRKPGN